MLVKTREKPIDELISDQPDLIETGMTTATMAVNMLIDQGASIIDLERLFLKIPEGGELAVRCRFWDEAQRVTELMIYDRSMISRVKSNGDNRGQSGASRDNWDQRDNRSRINNQGPKRYNGPQIRRGDNRPPQNRGGPRGKGQSGFGESQQRGGPTTHSQTADYRCIMGNN